jgi:hypothetical protein
MATLRSLLPGAGGAGVVAAPSGGISVTSPVWRQKPGSELVFVGSCTNSQDTNYCRNQLCCWTVPYGVTTITFEIWGGGGGGGGMCCCGFGVPGGPGAYAKKTVTGNLGGCNYNMSVAYTGCGTPGNSGYRGCQSWVTGYGLTNFCVEGGYPGCSYCNHYSNLNCGVYHSPAQNGACCSCYYGADFGCAGCGSMDYTDYQSADFCYYKFFQPVPPGLVSKGQSYFVTRGCQYTCGEVQNCKVSIGLPGGIVKAIGLGGQSAMVYGGGCCCGSGGGPGMIKVSYY